MTKLEELKKAHDTACSDYDYADAKMVLAEDAYTAAFDAYISALNREDDMTKLEELKKARAYKAALKEKK